MTPFARGLAVGVVLLAGATFLLAAPPAERPAHRADPTAPSPPFLWRVERNGHLAAYLFGTIHVPDPRVQKLPTSVVRAFEAADHVVTEIPLDADAQLSVTRALVLPPGQQLRDVLGEARFSRLTSAMRGALEEAEPMLATVVVTALNRLKPWAAMAQLALVEYLPDLISGRPSLDARLHADAQAAGKALSALETVREQASVFDAFTLDEQLALLDDALAQTEAATRTDDMPGRALVDHYLSGDVSRLVSAMQEQAPPDGALARKFEQVLLRDRNARMADRFESLAAAHPDDLLFVAVGTLHLVGEGSLPLILEARGYRVSRLTDPGR